MSDDLFIQNTDKFIDDINNVNEDDEDFYIRNFKNNFGDWEDLYGMPMPEVSENKNFISWKDICIASEELNITPCATKAVYEIESLGNGFLSDGRPKILFEAHVFYKELKKVGINPNTLINQFPNIISPKWNRTLYKGNEKEYPRLDLAISIHKEAALKSASWGAFQIMGFNYVQSGFGDIFDFILANETSAFEQLRSFGNFISANRLVKHLVTLNWAKFAEGYNGAGYASHQYDVKLKNAYVRCQQNNG